MTRLLIWWKRREARILSKHEVRSNVTIIALVGSVNVGRFKNGKEVK